jgi:hypothetical protein
MPFVFENSNIPSFFDKIYKEEISGIALFPFIFLKTTREEYPNVYNHELIHYYQYKETLVIGFLIISFGNFVFNLGRYGCNINKAYRSTLFEKEAYKYMNDLEYIQNRKRFAWLRN